MPSYRQRGKTKAAPESARLGLTALQQGAAEEALSHLHKALAEAPRDARIRTAHAMALEANRAPAEAIFGYAAALALDRRTEMAAVKLSTMLKTYGDIDPAPIDERGLRAALAFDTVDPLPIARTALARIKSHGTLAMAITLGPASGWAAAAAAVISGGQRKALDDPLLALALRNGINTDPEIELLLTAIRRHLLLDADTATRAQKSVYEFASALAEQCQNNEYLWSVEGDERAALAVLPETDYLLRALYEPIAAPAGAVRPRSLAALVERESAHRETERAAAAALPSLSDLAPDVAPDVAPDLADETSRAVAAQYEANPYPRWLRLTKPDGGAYTDYLRTFLADSERARFQGPFSVLVAGCGTGEQAVAAALGYGTRASVTGVDLSRPSLAYGARRARDYDMSNLTFIHGDILDLDGLAGHADLWGRADRVGQTDLGDRTVSGDRTGRTGQFDLIECIGVLHHMADPRAGWRKLTDRLAPGGAMLIGLYSAAARQHITDLRDRMQGTTADIAPDTIRAFRSGLLDAPDSDERQLIVATPEFYSLSSCRDLLFHTHEQPVTVPWIADSLDQLGLKFRGFLLPDARLARFRLEHPDANPTRDLAAWSNFEDSYPRTFAGMYQFWCHKPG